MCFPLVFFIHLLPMSSSFNSRKLFYPQLPACYWAASEEKPWQMEKQDPEPAGSDFQTRARMARWGHPLCHWGKLHW